MNPQDPSLFAATQPEHSMNTQRDQKYVQQAFSAALNQYNQNPFAYTRDWVFAGKPCTIQEFADLIWPGDSEDKMLFILTHSGPKTGPKQK